MTCRRTSTSRLKARTFCGLIGTAEPYAFQKQHLQNQGLVAVYRSVYSFPFYFVSVRLNLLEELPQPLQFFGIDAAILQDIQH